MSEPIAKAIYWEDYQVGTRRLTAQRTITEADIMLHADQTGDFHPYHVDAIWYAERQADPNIPLLWRHRKETAALPEHLASDLYRKDRPILAAVPGLECHQLSAVELTLDRIETLGSDIRVEVDRAHPE